MRGLESLLQPRARQAACRPSSPMRWPRCLGAWLLLLQVLEEVVWGV